MFEVNLELMLQINSQHVVSKRTRRMTGAEPHAWTVFHLLRSQKMTPVLEPVQRMMEIIPTMFQPSSSKLSRFQT